MVIGGFPAAFNHGAGFLHQRGRIDAMGHVAFGVYLFHQIDVTECHAGIMGLGPTQRSISAQTAQQIVLQVGVGFRRNQLPEYIHGVSKHVTVRRAVQIPLEATALRVGRIPGNARQFEGA